MASLNMVFGMAATRGRVMVTKATKKTGGSVEEEKGPFDWLMGALQRDQLLETDPVLKKVEEKSPTQPSNTVSVTNKKKSGGFGGLFAKN